MFNVRGIDFTGSFVSSYGMKYILVAVDYVSKFVEAVVLPNNEGKSVTAILKNYFPNLVPQGRLSGIGVPTFAISFSKHYLRTSTY